MPVREWKTFSAMWLILFLPVVSLAGCGWCWCPWGGHCDGGTTDTTAPTASSTDPADGTTDVAVNSRITATFSEAVDPATITAATFTVTGPDGTAVAGTRAFDVADNLATFTPTGDLAPDAEFTVTITTGVEDLAGNALASDLVWTFTTVPGAPVPDTTAPTVSSTSPADGATGVAINQRIAATFTEGMNGSSIVAAFTVTGPGATSVTGTVAYDVASKIATLTPAGNLATHTTYTARLTTGARDLAGNGLASAFAWSFTTGATSDTTSPLVNSTNPANAASGVVINTKITATFNEAMNSSTIAAATFTVAGPGTTPVSGNVAYAAVGSTATFTPAGNLALNTSYTATITTAVRDLAGNALAAKKTWTFTTGATTDTTDTSAPTVSSTNPADAATGVPINQRIDATFSEAMDPLTISTAHYTVTGPGAASVTGTVTYDVASHIAAFVPLTDLAPNAAFSARITTGVEDLAGNALATDFVWTFTTASGTTPTGPAPVVLGTAGGFVILAKSGIDTVPNSVVTGDIGVSPIDSTAITGFSLTLDASTTFSTSAQVTGRVFAADYAPPTPANMTTAISDMETAYTDAAGRSTPDFTELGAGDISGLTLVPGLYKWGTGVLISTDVTLSGGSNDVWIFQIAGGITQASATSVILAGGALPKNIFWQVFGAVAIDATAHFEGIILSQTEIALATGASINGRLLSQTAVTLDQSTVTQPAP
jgi:methionine-rich copper-binding protein CopC